MSISHGYAIRPELADCNELVIVCCHATYVKLYAKTALSYMLMYEQVGDGSDASEDAWILQGFQRADLRTGKPGEHETFIAHILAGAMMVDQRPQAILMFSGGMTSHSAFTEAEGYAKVFHSLGGRWETFNRYELENWATDSYQNLLFSILRFRQVCGHYPESITVITHAFKEDRFVDLHAPAIRWPSERFRVQGINPPFTKAELRQTQDGEEARAFTPFSNDPYGVQPSLANKRRARNWDPHMVTELSLQVEPEVAQLLAYEGGPSGRDVFPHKLPWEHS